MPVNNDELTSEELEHGQDDVEESGDPGGEPQIPPIKVTETEEYKQAQADLARERQERQRLENELRAAKEPPPPDKPKENPRGQLAEQLEDLEDEYLEARLWCKANQEHPNIRQLESRVTKMREQLRTGKEQLRRMDIDEHVNAVKEVAQKQGEAHRVVQAWRDEIGKQPATKDLSKKGQEHVLKLMIAGWTYDAATQDVRDLTDGGQPSKPPLSIVSGGRDRMPGMEGTDDVATTNATDAKEEAKLVRFWAKRLAQ